MSVIDISMPIEPRMVTWDDRFAPTVTWHSRTAHGDRTTNSTWTLNAHTGTHADAPLHHLRDGADVSALALGDTIGLCRVIDLTEVESEIGVADLEPHDVAAGERLLLRTRNSLPTGTRDPDGAHRFDPKYVALSVDAARWLVVRQVRLIGTDGLGVEPYGRPQATVHQALLNESIVILEGLRLGHVAPGCYQLVFLPLLLCGAEAAPGRAILLPTDA